MKTLDTTNAPRQTWPSPFVTLFCFEMAAWGALLMLAGNTAPLRLSISSVLLVLSIAYAAVQIINSPRGEPSRMLFAGRLLVASVAAVGMAVYLLNATRHL